MARTSRQDDHIPSTDLNLLASVRVVGATANQEGRLALENTFHIPQLRASSGEIFLP
jgi:hypothetical protein